MLAELVDHVIGIDPDRDRVTAAIIASNTTAVITTEEFTANASGYRDLLVWADAHSDASSRVWSIEGTRSYGAGATLTLEEADEWVIEFDRPANAASKDRAKTDTLDAIRAAREALGRHKVATPRSSGKRSQLQALKVARDSAQRARVAAIKQLRSLMVTSPVELRDELRGLTLRKLIDRASRLRPSGANAGIRTALRTLARRVRNLDQELKDLDALIKGLIDEMAPQLLDEIGISYTTATQILLSWSHQGRCHSEAAFARLAGVAPIPASSGQPPDTGSAAAEIASSTRHYTSSL